MKSLWLTTLLLLSVSALAQQPPVRVRLLTLYHLKQITVTPRGESSLQQGSNKRPIERALTISAQRDFVETHGLHGNKFLIVGEVELTGEQMHSETLHAPIEVTSQNGELHLIAIFPLEDYVAAVLQGETAGQMPPEALKALAVAVRSYGTKFRERHKEEGFDFCDTTHCQFLRTVISANVRAAVTATRSELLWDRGSPLAAYYHKNCGGRTEDVTAIWPDQKSPSLVSHEDPYCTRITKPWRSEISRNDIARALDAANLQVPTNWDRIAVRDRTVSGRAKLIVFSVGASQQRATVSASTFRFALGRTMGWNTLKSDWYEVTSSGDHYIFKGRGTGHGIGLCQEGAEELAREGKTYREILAFYYPEALVGHSAQGIPWTTVREDDFDVRTVKREDASTVVPVARQAMTWAKHETGLEAKNRPEVQIYPTVAMFRDATGEPGWVAAVTRDERIRLQPPAILGDRLTAILRHEFLHVLIESNAKANAPIWFREGLVLEISGETGRHSDMKPGEIEEAITSRASEASVKQAYSAAAALVFQLEKKYGRDQLMGWLRNGIPGAVLAVQSHEVSQ